MKEQTHTIIHLLSEIQKEEDMQIKSAMKKKNLLNELGKIVEEMIKEEI